MPGERSPTACARNGGLSFDKSAHDAAQRHLLLPNARVCAIQQVLRRVLAGNVGLLDWLHVTRPLPHSIKCNPGLLHGKKTWVCSHAVAHFLLTLFFVSRFQAVSIGCACRTPTLDWTSVATATVESDSTGIAQWALARRRDSHRETSDEDTDAVAARHAMATCAASLGRVETVVWLIYKAWPGVPSRSLLADLLSAAAKHGRHAVVNWVLNGRRDHNTLASEAAALALARLAYGDFGSDRVGILASAAPADRLVDAICESVQCYCAYKLAHAMEDETRECDWLAVPRAFIRAARSSLRRSDIAAVTAARGGIESLVPRAVRPCPIPTIVS
jgi:hypothetical protein